MLGFLAVMIVYSIAKDVDTKNLELSRKSMFGLAPTKTHGSLISKRLFRIANDKMGGIGYSQGTDYTHPSEFSINS
jgi:hypothetical protein